MAAAKKSTPASSRQSPPSPTNSSGKPKCARTKHACDECRRSQKKCDGDRRQCQRCYTNGIQCTYSPHKSRGQQERPVVTPRERIMPEMTVFPTDSLWSASSSPSNSPQLYDVDTSSDPQTTLYFEPGYASTLSGHVRNSAGTIASDVQGHFHGAPMPFSTGDDYSSSTGIQVDYTPSTHTSTGMPSPPIVPDPANVYASYSQTSSAYPSALPSMPYPANNDTARHGLAPSALSTSATSAARGGATTDADYSSQYYLFNNEHPSSTASPPTSTDAGRTAAWTGGAQQYMSPSYSGGVAATASRSPLSATRLGVQNDYGRTPSPLAPATGLPSYQHSQPYFQQQQAEQTFPGVAPPLRSFSSLTGPAQQRRGDRDYRESPSTSEYGTRATSSLSQQEAASSLRGGIPQQQLYQSLRPQPQDSQIGYANVAWSRQAQQPGSSNSLPAVDSTGYASYSNTRNRWSQQ